METHRKKLSALVTLFACGVVCASASPRSQVLFVVADDYGWNDVGYHQNAPSCAAGTMSGTTCANPSGQPTTDVPLKERSVSTSQKRNKRSLHPALALPSASGRSQNAPMSRCSSSCVFSSLNRATHRPPLGTSPSRATFQGRRSLGRTTAIQVALPTLIPSVLSGRRTVKKGTKLRGCFEPSHAPT